METIDKKLLENDIIKLKNKLIEISNKQIKIHNQAESNNNKDIRAKSIELKKDIRLIRNELKDKIKTYEVIQKIDIILEKKINKIIINR